MTLIDMPLWCRLLIGRLANSGLCFRYALQVYVPCT